MRPNSYTTCIYVGCTITAHVHRVLCPKLKNGVGFPCHITRSMILDLPYTRNIYDSALQVPFEGYKWAISKLWKKEKNSTLRAKLLWRNYSLHIESASLCPFKSEHIVQPPSSSLFDGEPHFLSYMSLPLVED
jgi:hypothetical protein